MHFAHTFIGSDVRLVALGAIGAFAGLYWFYKGFRLLQRKRLILNTPASKVRSASMGLVEISGLAVGPYVVRSPLQQVDSYYYRSVAWELRQQGKSSQWVKVAEETLHVPFYVDDGTGKVLVDPRGAEMELHCDVKEQYNRSALFGPSEMPGNVAEFLVRQGADPGKHIKVEEYCIKPKNFLFVLGTLSQNPGLDATVMPSWADRPGQRRDIAVADSEPASDGPGIIRLSHIDTAVPVTQMTQQQKIAAALMKAGVSNPSAWEAAGIGIASGSAAAAARLEAVTVQQGSASEHKLPGQDSSTELPDGFDLHPPVVLMKGTHDPAFFISWRSQRDLVNALGWKSALMIFGGPVLTLGSVYFLLAQFSWL